MVQALGAHLLLVPATTIGRLRRLDLQGADELADAARRSAGRH